MVIEKGVEKMPYPSGNLMIFPFMKKERKGKIRKMKNEKKKGKMEGKRIEK